MKTLVYDNEPYMITRQDSVTVAIRSTGINRVKILKRQVSGEISVISRCVPWLHNRLEAMNL